MIENYLQILEESLIKKTDILKQITAENKNQESVLKEEKVSMEKFEEAVDRKAVLIEELNRLDQGFERLYDRIREQLLEGRAQYQDQINTFQKLIADITEASVSIQAQEARNKVLVEKYFAESRDGIKGDRIRSKQAYDYYRRMSSNTVAPRFLDEKQ